VNLKTFGNVEMVSRHLWPKQHKLIRVPA
jgi:hypothetical protein